jgi:hypothetical protein
VLRGSHDDPVDARLDSQLGILVGEDPLMRTFMRVVSRLSDSSSPERTGQLSLTLAHRCAAAPPILLVFFTLIPGLISFP